MHVGEEGDEGWFEYTSHHLVVHMITVPQNPYQGIGELILILILQFSAESVPPVSIFYPPSGDHSAKTVLPASLPSDAISNSAIVILLDWTKPSRIIPELVEWLKWIQEWAGGHDTSMRDQCESVTQSEVEKARDFVPICIKYR